MGLVFIFALLLCNECKEPHYLILRLYLLIDCDCEANSWNVISNMDEHWLILLQLIILSIDYHDCSEDKPINIYFRQRLWHPNEGLNKAGNILYSTKEILSLPYKPVPMSHVTCEKYIYIRTLRLKFYPTGMSSVI